MDDYENSGGQIRGQILKDGLEGIEASSRTPNGDDLSSRHGEATILEAIESRGLIHGREMTGKLLRLEPAHLAYQVAGAKARLSAGCTSTQGVCRKRCSRRSHA